MVFGLQCLYQSVLLLLLRASFKWCDGASNGNQCTSILVAFLSYLERQGSESQCNMRRYYKCDGSSEHNDEGVLSPRSYYLGVSESPFQHPVSCRGRTVIVRDRDETVVIFNFDYSEDAYLKTE